MPNKYFLIGIKGAGLSSLARILKQSGHEVIGSDLTDHMHTQDYLDNDGIKYYAFNEYEFSSDYIVIVGNSFTSEFSEVKYAKVKGNEMYWYYEFLGQMSKMYNCVAVTGTHGKTTTTTMLKNAFKEFFNLSYLIGDGNGGGVHEPDYFIFEACEYKNHFHSYYPDYAIITNVDHDHLDFFLSQEMYNESFITFSKNVKKSLIVCFDDENARKLFNGYSNVISYGIDSEAVIMAKNVQYTATGTVFDLYVNREFITTYHTCVFGKHNVLNLLSVIGVAYAANVNVLELTLKYDGYMAPKRRFEEYFYEEQIVIDDYAHHPDELQAFLSSVVQKYPNKKLISVFEPHTVSRLEEHYKAFSECLNVTDYQIILDVKIPLRDLDKITENSMKSNVMLDFLTNGEMYDNNTFEKLAKYEDAIVLFIGPTIFEYTEKYLDYINLIFKRK